MTFRTHSYLKSFTAEKVWGNRTFDWQGIDQDVNIVVGINGSGKTTFLNIMYNYLNGSNFGGKYLISTGMAIVPFLEYVHFVRSFDTPANDKRKNESQLLQQLNSVLFQNKEGFSFFNYRMKILDEPHRANDIQRNIENLFQVIDEMLAETGKKVEISRDSTSQLVFRQDDRLLNVEQLSTGEKQLLLLLLTVFLQDNKPAILFADEPEVSLHISWQQVLIDNLKRLNPNCQLIIATHSPSIISRGWGDKVVDMKDIVK